MWIWQFWTLFACILHLFYCFTATPKPAKSTGQGGVRWRIWLQNCYHCTKGMTCPFIYKSVGITVTSCKINQVSGCTYPFFYLLAWQTKLILVPSRTWLNVNQLTRIYICINNSFTQGVKIASAGTNHTSNS